MFMYPFFVDLKQNSAKKLGKSGFSYSGPDGRKEGKEQATIKTTEQQGTDFGGLAIVQNYLT